MGGTPQQGERDSSRTAHRWTGVFATLVYLTTACALVLLDAHWNRALFHASAAPGAGAAAWRRIADWILAGP